MNSRIFLPLVGLLVSASALLPASSAQTSDKTTASSTSPVAFVYVSRSSDIDGFAVSASGKLTPVPGSPFAYSGYGKLSVSKHFLFGLEGNDYDVSSFSIASNGSIKKVATLNLQKYEPDFCGGPPVMQVDTTGTTLYVQESVACPNDHQGYVSVHVASNGDLTYLGSSGGFLDWFGQGDTIQLTMAGTNQYAYDGWCGEEDNNTSAVDIYKRESNGMLQFVAADNNPPTDYSGNGYCAGQVAADSENHLAVAYQRLDSEGGDNGPWSGPYFLATYTMNSAGDFATSSTSDNMPEVSDTITYNEDVTALSISPANNFLAVGGLNGFQVFHFNGGNPITPYSGPLLPGATIGKFGWDKSNHLFVYFGSSLYVYTVTADSIKQAAGSPYTIDNANNLIVRDLQ